MDWPRGDPDRLRGVSAADGYAATDPYDAAVAEIGFVVRRRPDREWRITDLVNRRYHILAYAASGRALYRCEGQGFQVRQGQMLFFPRGFPHSGQSDPDVPWSFFSTTFTLDYLDRRAEVAYANLPFVTDAGNPIEVQALFTELERVWGGRETGSRLRCRSIIQHLLYLYVRGNTQRGEGVLHAQKLATVAAHLQAHLSQTFVVDELADMADLSPSRFRALFKQFTGQSVVQYQNWLRVNKAKDLLLSGEYLVTEAAREVGIPDVYYFSRLFKKLTGYNPSYFRNQ